MLEPDGISVGNRKISYASIVCVRLHQFRAQDGSMIDRCTLRGQGGTFYLQSQDITGWATVEDRRAEYEPFVREMLLRIAPANPAVRVFVGMPGTSRAGWIFILVLCAGLGLGGLALLAAGDWEGIWLIVTAITTAPLAVSTVRKKPSRLVEISDIAALGAFRDLSADVFSLDATQGSLACAADHSPRRATGAVPNDLIAH